MMIHNISEGRLNSIKKMVERHDIPAEEFGRSAQQPRWNKKYETVRTFLAGYFDKAHGKCEKLPNPRYGRDEWRLPTWLKKDVLYDIYKKDQVEMGGKKIHSG